MFYYEIIKRITNVYDSNPLQVVGFIKCFTDEAKTELLTELPFGELGVHLMVSDCPTYSAESFNNFIEEKVLGAVNKPEIQEKLQQVKLLKDLGLI